jgi:hypothetical protein
MVDQQRQGPAPRWVHAAPGTGLDAELGDAFRLLEHEEPMSDAELGRVQRRLSGAAARRRPVWFRLAPVVLAVLLGATSAALADWLRPGIWNVRSWLTTHTVSKPPASARGAAPVRRAVPVTTEAVTPPLPAIVTEPVPPAAPSTPAPLTSSSPSGVALESELLQRALERLRREHDGAAALRALDDYRRRFPAGVLASEAAVARIDALLLLGRRGEALDQLQRLPLSHVGRRTELQLLRAELQAERSCPKALPDFDSVLAASASAPLTERALYGRATCRLRLGDSPGARLDLERYLTRFPSGRFASQVRSRLEADGAL